MKGVWTANGTQYTKSRKKSSLFSRHSPLSRPRPLAWGFVPLAWGFVPLARGFVVQNLVAIILSRWAPGNHASPRCISQKHPEFWVIRLVSYAMLGNSVAGGVLGPAAQGAGFYFPKIGGGHSPGSRQNQRENQIMTYIRQANWQSVKHRLPVGKGISPMGRLDVYLDPPEHNNPHCLCSSPHWEEQLRRPDDGHVNKAGTALGRCSLKGKKPAPW